MGGNVRVGAVRSEFVSSILDLLEGGMPSWSLDTGANRDDNSKRLHGVVLYHCTA